MTRAWKYGHFWTHSPDLTLGEAVQLDLDHPLAQGAWLSWRESDANYVQYLHEEHNRYSSLDETWGPATERLVARSRCPLPDHPPPDNISFSGLQDWEQQVLHSYRRHHAEGSGSWPQGCVPGSEDVHAIRINLDVSQAAAHWEADLPEVTSSVAAAYAELGLRVIYVINGDPQRAEIEKRFERIPGGVIGWNEFPTPNTCGQTISGRLDNDYRAGAHMKSILELHETGHGVGLRHTRGGVMNPSILDVPVSWRGDPSERTLIRYFGGQSIPVVPGDPEPEPDPGSPLPGGRPVISYTERGIQIDGFAYQLTPRPGV